jgi:hypothetical protein
LCQRRIVPNSISSEIGSSFNSRLTATEAIPPR